MKAGNGNEKYSKHDSCFVCYRDGETFPLPVKIIQAVLACEYSILKECEDYVNIA